jgi:phenylacetate-coenzyme A ligase PaaK-like adenylate-forming protein
MGGRDEHKGTDQAIGESKPQEDEHQSPDEALAAVKVGSNVVPVEHVARTVERVEGLAPDFRLMVSTDGQDDHLTVEAETLRPVPEDELRELGERLLDALMSEMEDVVHEMTDKKDARLTLRVLQPGSLPRNPSTDEVRRVVDERGIVH